MLELELVVEETSAEKSKASCSIDKHMVMIIHCLSCPVLSQKQKEMGKTPKITQALSNLYAQRTGLIRMDVGERGDRQSKDRIRDGC